MKFTALLIFLFLCSCSSYNFKKDRAAFEASKVTQRFVSVADMNDAYFVIKENNFFEFYRQLFDSIKNTSYPGTYTKAGDTLLLKFYDKKGYELLGKKALVKKTEIIFFNDGPISKKKTVIH